MKYSTFEERGMSRRAQREMRTLLITRGAKNVPCVDCGRRYPHYVMDLDHVRGEKIECVGAMAKSWSTGRARMEAEVAKCEAVCSNCHRERSYGVKAREADVRRARRWKEAMKLTWPEVIKLMKAIGARKWR